MKRTDFFFKVELEHDPAESLEQLGEEIRRHIKKLYGVRAVELSNFTAQPD